MSVEFQPNLVSGGPRYRDPVVSPRLLLPSPRRRVSRRLTPLNSDELCKLGSLITEH